MKQQLIKTIIASFLCALVLTLLSTNNVQARKSLANKWPNKSATVTFYCGINGTWALATSAAMSSWNAVKELTTGNDLVPLVVNTSTSTLSNKIYATTGYTWLASAIPVASNGLLTSVGIAINFDYSYATSASPGHYDMQSLILHELGHAIGVAHCHEYRDLSCFSTTCNSNVMQPTLSENITRRTLQDYDKASKQMTYY